MANIWKILEIEKTKDKDILKNAYRKKLAVTNPEDDAEGFKALRNAYEEALRYADEEDVTDESEVNEVEEVVYEGVQIIINDIYKDFAKRIDTACWEELFETEYFTSLEYSADSTEKLLAYMMDHYLIPQKVLKLIVDKIDLEEKKADLLEVFPFDFINYIVENSTYADLINYYLFEGELDSADEYLSLYFSMNRYINESDYENATSVLEELKTLPVYHPYTDLTEIKKEIYVIREKQEDFFVFEGEDLEKLNTFRETVNPMLEKYSDDNLVFMVAADIELSSGNFDRVIELMMPVYEKDNLNMKAIINLANANVHLDKYEEAKEWYIKELDINPYYEIARGGLFYCNNKLIEQYKAKPDEEKEDHKVKQEIVWAYNQNFLFNEGIEVLDTFEPTFEESFAYYNSKGRMYLSIDKSEEAIECLEKWKEAIDSLDTYEGDDIDDIKGKKERKPYVNALLAETYMKLKKYDRARACIDEAMARECKERLYVHEVNCRLYYEQRLYGECCDACDNALLIEPNDYLFTITRAKASYKLGYYSDCMDYANRAINIYPYASIAYAYQIRVYQDVKRYDDADEVISTFESYEQKSDLIEYYKAKNLFFKDQVDEAISKIENLVQSYNKDDSDLESYEEVLCFLADFYDESGDDDKAIDIYKKVIEINPEYKNVHGFLAYMYRKKKDYDDAIAEYTRQLEIEEEAFYYSCRGDLYERQFKYDKAIADFEACIKIDSTRSTPYFHLGRIMKLYKRYDEAFENYEKALSCVNENEVDRIIEIKRMLARCVACKHDYKYAIEILEDALEEYGDEYDTNLRYELALSYTRDKNYEGSKDILMEYLENGEDEHNLFWFSSLLMELSGEEESLETALEMKEKALKLRPNDAKIYSKMGRLYRMNFMYEKAAEEYRKSYEADPNGFDDDDILLECILKSKGSLDEEDMKFFERGLCKPEDMNTPKEYNKMAILYKCIGEYDKAVEYIIKSVEIPLCEYCGYPACDEGYYEMALIYYEMEEYAKAYDAIEKCIKAHGHCGVYNIAKDMIESKLG